MAATPVQRRTAAAPANGSAEAAAIFAGHCVTRGPALAKLLDEGIQRGEGHLDVAAGVRVPGA